MGCDGYDCTQERDALRAKNNDLQTRINLFEGEVERWTGEFEALRADLDAARAEVERLKQELDGAYVIGNEAATDLDAARKLLERWIEYAGGLSDCDTSEEGHDGGYDCSVCGGHMANPDSPDLDSGHARDCVQLLSCQLLHAQKRGGYEIHKDPRTGEELYRPEKPSLERGFAVATKAFKAGEK